MTPVSQYAMFHSVDSDEDICCLFFTFSHAEKSESEYLSDNEDEGDEEMLQENPIEPALRPQEVIHILHNQFEHVPFALILVTFNSVDIVSRDVDESFLMQLKLKWDWTKR